MTQRKSIWLQKYRKNRNLIFETTDSTTLHDATKKVQIFAIMWLRLKKNPEEWFICLFFRIWYLPYYLMLDWKMNKTKWIWISDREKRRYKATILQRKDHTRPQKIVKGHVRQQRPLHTFCSLAQFLFHLERHLRSCLHAKNKNNKASFRTFGRCSRSKM